MLIIYLPTFCESNAWDFYLVMSKISGSVQATSEDFQWISEDFWTLPEIECSQMLQRCLSTSKATKKMTLILAYFDFVRTQKRTQSHHVVKNNLSRFVGQTNCPWCIRSMYLVHRRETHAKCVRIGKYIIVCAHFYHGNMRSFVLKKPVTVLCFTFRHLVNQVRRQFSDLESEFQSSVRNSGVSSKWRQYFFSMNIWIQ